MEKSGNANLDQFGNREVQLKNLSSKVRQNSTQTLRRRKMMCQLSKTTTSLCSTEVLPAVSVLTLIEKKAATNETHADSMTTKKLPMTGKKWRKRNARSNPSLKDLGSPNLDSPKAQVMTPSKDAPIEYLKLLLEGFEKHE